MKLYRYNPITKQYIGSIDAQFDPLELEKNGVEKYLIPAYTTDIPPVIGKDYFINNAWVSEPFEKIKTAKLAENDKAVAEKQYFTTSAGQLGLNTIVGSLATAMTGLIAADLPDYSGNFFTYDGLPIQNLDNAAFKALYAEVLQKYMAFDGKTRQIKFAINSAATPAELEAIIVDYTDL